MSKDKDYEVGYGRPPKATQFRKGRSGNPRGRPRKAKEVRVVPSVDFDQIFLETISQEVTVTVGGKRVVKSYGRVIVERYVHECAAGKIRNPKHFFDLVAAVS